MAKETQSILQNAAKEMETNLQNLPQEIESKLYGKFDLTSARLKPSKKNPASHQRAALDKLHSWFQAPSHSQGAGGIMVLPTGGGKTFTAIRFLCQGPLSRGYKVLWLAHTHHLLEQAYETFAPMDESKADANGTEIGRIAEPKTSLAIRVVSGTPGHLPVKTVKSSDDVLIITLQTLARAWEKRNRHRGLKDFFTSAGEKLFVVFDEAHHAPAPGYRALITDLRKHHPGMFLLGLTATPTYTDTRKIGWLKKLFPQEIIYQVSASKLMAAGVLAKPIFERTKTDYTPTFNQRDYEKWIGTYRDLPEDIIENLAKNQERNTLIAETYVKNRNHYGKTIIFAERWHQCEFICELLRRRGVRAGAVYSHVDAYEATASARNKRASDENSRVLAAFQKDELDVLINVKMLTEGTDVPKLNTVFLTRETTSRILATQMVGRALRGPKFGGTKEAYIVSFQDNWQHQINFAEYAGLENEDTIDDTQEHAKRPPLQLISIELVRRLTRVMDTGVTTSPGPFVTLLPTGWYVTQYDALVDGTDDTETIRDFILVFEDRQDAYTCFIKHLESEDLAAFSSERLMLADVQSPLKMWSSQFFEAAETQHQEELLKPLLDIARHMAQGEYQRPKFIPFDMRSEHDLDTIAQRFIDEKLGPREQQDALITEYRRTDLIWPDLYLSYNHFKSQCDACVNYILDSQQPTAPSVPPEREMIPIREPLEAVKRQVKRRDGFRCLCCGEDNRGLLQVDHSESSHFGGSNSLENLQTLCKTCNMAKGTDMMNFQVRHNQIVTMSPNVFPELEMPLGQNVKNANHWKRFLQREINFFYQCAAVNEVHIGARGKEFYEWEIELCDGNDPGWLVPFLKPLVKNIQNQILAVRNDGYIMQRLIVQAPDAKSVAWPSRSKW